MSSRLSAMVPPIYRCEAVGEAFGKEVTWDGTTNSVYIGEKPASGVSVERTSFSLGTMQYSIDSSWVSRDNVNSDTIMQSLLGMH